MCQANTLAPYLAAIRNSLDSALCLRNFPSQVIERHNKPEVELRCVCYLGVLGVFGRIAEFGGGG